MRLAVYSYIGKIALKLQMFHAVINDTDIRLSHDIEDVMNQLLTKVYRFSVIPIYYRTEI